MSECRLCPRFCGADRSKGPGSCGAGDKIKVARAALHFWEEPCICGSGGSGAVFFSGCPLGCVYCQNKDISDGRRGAEITPQRLYDIFFELKEKSAENINLITCGHFLPQVIPPLRSAKENGLGLPVVYNTSSYETVSAIKSLEGLVDIFLPDLKYISSELSSAFSACPDYFERASAAIDEMFRITGKCIFDENERLISGTIIRHLVLPGHTDDSKAVIEYLFGRYGNEVVYSIMSQYTPVIKNSPYPELLRKLTAEEYDDVIDFAIGTGIENAYIQDGDSAEESFIPDFGLEGVFPEP
ncbi:MAG: radical SAM protein [Clostridia bacterium]|nr:radical SAM protein [Clostridia bacterium]